MHYNSNAQLCKVHNHITDTKITRFIVSRVHGFLAMFLCCKFDGKQLFIDFQTKSSTLM